MNPFEDENQEYYALANEEGQYSLWPTFIDVPAGWAIEHGPATRQACLTHVDRNWKDMRPKSLVRLMDND